MKKKAFMVIVSCLWCLEDNILARGADEPVFQANPPAVANTQTEKDLQLFFEDRELVTATKRPTSVRKAPANATVITADEIRNMGARNLLDALKMVPGMGLSINEFGVNMVEVRGIRTGTSEKILVMIDGHSLNKNINGSALYNVVDMLPLENIRQVEVVRGPGSALYGNSAFVATINIITRNAEEINGLEAKAGGGSFDSSKVNLVGGKAIGDKLTVSGSLDHQQTQGARLTVDADTLTGTPYSLAPGTPNLDFRQTDTFLKVGYGDLSFRGQYLTRRKELFIGIASALTDESSEDPVDNFWGELAYSLPLTQGLSTHLQLYYDQYEQHSSVKIYPNGFAGVFPDGMIAKPLATDRTIGYQQQFDWDPFKMNHLISGFSVEEMRQGDVRQLTNYNPTTGAPLGSVQEVANWNRNAARQIWAVYLQDEWQLPARVNLTAGVRDDHYSDFGNTVNPRVGMVWSFLETADLKLLYGKAFRAPNFQELYNINNPVVVGNPDLKPERITTYEAGPAWRLNRFFAASLTYFHSTIDDQIGWDTSTTPYVNANIGSSETQGIELGMDGAFAADLNWKLSYAWQDPRNADTDERLPYVPSQRASGSVNYALSQYVNLHSDVLWTGPRPRDVGDSRPETPSYTTVDVAVTLKNFYRSFEIQGTVRNLFDQRYEDPDTSGGAVNLARTGPKVPYDFPREGISGFLMVSYKF